MRYRWTCSVLLPVHVLIIRSLTQDHLGFVACLVCINKKAIHEAQVLLSFACGAAFGVRWRWREGSEVCRTSFTLDWGMVLVGALCRKWQYAENALQDPDPFEADTILDAHDVKVPIPRFAWPA